MLPRCNSLIEIAIWWLKGNSLVCSWLTSFGNCVFDKCRVVYPSLRQDTITLVSKHLPKQLAQKHTNEFYFALELVLNSLRNSISHSRKMDREFYTSNESFSYGAYCYVMFDFPMGKVIKYQYQFRVISLFDMRT